MRREVALSDGGPIGYDTLIVATGARHSYFGHDDWARHAPGLKTLEDATEIRRRIMIAFEAAEREADPDRRRAWMTFLLGGWRPDRCRAGRIARRRSPATPCAATSGAIDPAEARIILVEALDRVLPTYPADRSRIGQAPAGAAAASGAGSGTRVIDIDDDGVTVTVGDDPTATTETSRGPDRPVGRRCGRVVVRPAVAEATAAATDRNGTGHGDRRPDRPRAPGDLRRRRCRGAAVEARAADSRRRPGRDAGRDACGSHDPSARSWAGRPEPFRYSNKGDVAVIGRLAGVTNIPWLGPFGRQGGFTAWLLWLGIHIFYLIGFANRIVVVTRWGVSFLTHGRNSRLITGVPLLPDIERPEPPVMLEPEPDPGASTEPTEPPSER